MLVGDAAGAEFAGYAVFALVADFGALAGELFGVASIVDQAVLLQAGDDFLMRSPSAVRRMSAFFMSETEWARRERILTAAS